MRRFTLVLMVPIVLLLGIPALAQTGPDTGASSLEAEVAQLKRLVADHERRIAALEALLAKSAPAPAPSDSAEQARQPVPAPTATEESNAQSDAEVPPWASEASWKKLRIGMSEDEVLELLGPPDSTREIGFTRRLIYKGEVPGRGFLKGVVKLSDGAVSDLDLPDF